MTCRIAAVPKIQYDYFNRGTFALPKTDKLKKDKESIKTIPGLSN
jgi:hypothetical protein